MSGGRVRRLLGTILPAAVLAGNLISAGAIARASTIPEFGVHVHAGWDDYTNAQRLEVMDKMAAAGVGWVRIDLSWAWLEGGGPGDITDYYLDRMDFTVDAANDRGLRVLMVLFRTPSWANDGAGNKVPPDDANDFGAIAGFLADHFQGRVHAWEIWNEPNSDDFFVGTPARYTQMLRAAYLEIKAADPAASVVLGGPSNKELAWLDGVYDAGGKAWFDVMSVHAYMSPSDLPPETKNGTIWTLAAASQVKALMQDHGDGSTPIWYTEYGWSSHPNTGDEPNWNKGVTQEEQGDYLVRSLQFLGSEYPYVTNVFWYNERNRDAGHPHEDNFGLLRRDLSEKPVYEALQSFMTGQEPPPDGEEPPPDGEEPPPDGEEPPPGDGGDDCTLLGTPGDDVLPGTDGPDVICAYGGNDVVRAGDGQDTVYAGDGNDVVNGGEDDDVLLGSAGNDRVLGLGGNDRLLGHDGRDGLFGGVGGDHVEGGPGVNRLTGGAGADVLRGGAFRDVMPGGGGADRILGFGGRDRIRSRDRFRDVALGGSGRDLCFVDRRDSVKGCPGG